MATAPRRARKGLTRGTGDCGHAGPGARAMLGRNNHRQPPFDPIYCHWNA